MNLEIANRLVKLRKDNHLSQEELAEKIGISRQAVSKWERAEASPDTDNLILLARLYHISIDELLRTDGPVESVSPAEPAGSSDMHFEKACCDTAAHPPDAGETKTEPVNDFWMRFPYTILIVIIYLSIGFLLDIWHPTWLLFITIPIYYWIVSDPFHRKDN